MTKPDTTFDRAFDRVLGHEVGYVNHPNDPGGETNWGITVAVARAHGYTGSMRDLPRDVAKEIYRNDYWRKVEADSFHPAIGFQLFDLAVNHGPKTAIKLLQRAVGVADDGVIGPITRRAVHALHPYAVVMRANAERIDYYTKLAAWPTFSKGWVRRVAGNLRYGAQDT